MSDGCGKIISMGEIYHIFLGQVFCDDCNTSHLPSVYQYSWAQEPVRCGQYLMAETPERIRISELT